MKYSHNQISKDVSAIHVNSFLYQQFAKILFLKTFHITLHLLLDSTATMESATIRIFSYIRFAFCDKKDNVIWIFKQPTSPFNERNKLGFEIKINNIMIRTGKQSYFDY